MIEKPDVWMISNRQPWVELLARGLIRSKTRSVMVTLPPVGATVYLHASKALWSGWRNLVWLEKRPILVTALPRGGVVARAHLVAVGPTKFMMPAADRAYFEVRDDPFGIYSCADEMTMVFDDVVRLPFIPCRGSLVPTRKLPPELLAFLQKQEAGNE
jgi:hypothetical protein